MQNLDNADKSGIIHALIGAVAAAYFYFKGIDFDFAQIDYEIAFEWLAGVGALLGFTNRRNRKINDEPAPGALDEVTGSSEPMGVRLNNPGNLRPDKRWTWQGQTGVYVSPVSGEFVKFDTIDNGMRAAARNLLNQQRLHGLRTIDAIIKKYAPESENDTESYIAAMVSSTGYSRNHVFDLEDTATAVKMLRAIIKHEQGRVDYSTETILRGVKAA